MLVWVVHDGGFDEDTWYWGALVSVALVALTVVTIGTGRVRRSRPAMVALILFALYVAWSYLSISWASSPGVALTGSNRALLYLAVFTLAVLLPWTPEAALIALLTFAIGVGVVAIVLVTRLASADHVLGLLNSERIASPTGYYNATAALFTIDALVSIGLACRRELPGLLRGLLLTFAAASLQLAVAGQSRGWLFTLPIVALITIICVNDRLRYAAAAVLPVVAALIPVRGLLKIYDDAFSPSLNSAASHAGQESLLLLAGVFVLGTLLAWTDRYAPVPRPGVRGRRILGTVAATIAVAGGCAGLVAVSHGRPFHFISSQWSGFSHPQQSDTSSHFSDVGSGRYDYWRVALDAFVAHPIGGLGQDNFADYYITRRHTTEEPVWTHSLELRLLAHTGIVGFALFAGFIVFALIAAARSRRRGPPLTRAIAGVALLPLVVWVVHGSVDWFWEIPALSGPALGFLGMAASICRVPEPDEAERTEPTSARRRIPRPVAVGVGLVLMLAVVAVLAFPYLSVREVSLASDVSATNPAAALADLAHARTLNPLDADPGRLAGAIALENGQYQTAVQRFRQSVSNEPGGWFAWLGAGLAESALGNKSAAHRDFATAHAINSQETAIHQALARVYTLNPLTSAQAFSLLESDQQ